MTTVLLSNDEVLNRLKLLNSDTHGGWQIVNKKLCKEFVFKSFESAMVFMSKCAIKVEKMNHHPEWSNIYNKVSVQLITHEEGGITCLDFELAAMMEELALDV